MFVNFRLIVQDFYLVEVRFLLLRPIFILTVNIYFLWELYHSKMNGNSFLTVTVFRWNNIVSEAIFHHGWLYNIPIELK